MVFLGDFLLPGSRIASWLPSFSVEVMHTTNILGIAQASNSQLNVMVRLHLSLPVCIVQGKGYKQMENIKGKEVKTVVGH